MPSFADSIFLFVLALLLFGPKKLPVLARELGKWMGEFRRASNEFKMQMEDELRASEQADRQKQITAMEAAAPIPPKLDEPAEPEHPHMRNSTPENTILPPTTDPGAPSSPTASSSVKVGFEEPTNPGAPSSPTASPSVKVGYHDPAEPTQTADGARPIPIATSGSLNMMPPATGLPTPRTRPNANPLGGLVDSIPEAPTTNETESLAHGD